MTDRGFDVVTSAAAKRGQSPAKRGQSPGETGTVPDSDAAPQLEAVMHLIWDRIEALEAEKRSLRRIVMAGLAAAAIAIVVAAIIFSTRPSPRDVALRDAAGRVRARFEVDSQNGATSLQLLDENGRAQAILAAGDAGPTLSFFDRQGKARLRMGLATDLPVVDVIDAKFGRTTRIDLANPAPTAVVSEAAAGPASRVVASRGRGPSSGLARVQYPACGRGALGCYSRARFGGAG
jgi:hypothetical protein